MLSFSGVPWACTEVRAGAQLFLLPPHPICKKKMRSRKGGERLSLLSFSLIAAHTIIRVIAGEGWWRAQARIRALPSEQKESGMRHDV